MTESEVLNINLSQVFTWVLYSVVFFESIIIYNFNRSNKELIKDLQEQYTKNLQLSNKLQSNLVFSELMEFLLYIIKFKVENYIEINIKTELLKKDVTILSDSTFQKHLEDCTMSIFESINSEYSTQLCNFFTYNGLLSYIIECVYVSIFHFYCETNKSFLLQSRELVKSDSIEKAKSILTERLSK